MSLTLVCIFQFTPTHTGRQIIEIGTAPTPPVVQQQFQTVAPTSPAPTDEPTVSPSTMPPTDSPTMSPTYAPSKTPTGSPSEKKDEHTYPPIAEANCEDKPLDICIAVDMSNSICSPSSGVVSCTDCGECQEAGMDSGTCCGNFEKQLNFTKTFIERMDAFNLEQRFSLVAFSTNAIFATHLVDSDSAIKEVDEIQYVGGWTNTGDAIKFCYDTLKESSNERAMVLITDGTPTAGEISTDPTGVDPQNVVHQAYAEGQAQNVKGAGILIIPVAVDSVSNDTAKLEAIASDPKLVISADDFESLELQSTLDTLVANVKCGSDSMMQGTWTTEAYDEFEESFGDWTKLTSGIGKGGLVSRYNFTQCPQNSGEKCVRLYFDTDINTILNNTDYKDVQLVSKGFDVTDASMFRIKFDFVASQLELADEDHFHLEYQINGGEWIDLAIYVTGVHFNNDVEGTIEKLHDVSNDNGEVKVRFHLDGNEVNDFLFLDNIKIETYHET